MADPRGYSFSKDVATRVTKATKRVEQDPRSNIGPPIGRQRQDLREAWAKVTSSTLSGSTVKHAWTEQRRTSTGWQDMPSGMSGTTSTDYAVAKDPSQQVPTGVVCRIYWSNDSSDNRQMTLDTSIYVGQLFRVALTQTGGSNGSKTTAATWTYTATSLSGVSLGTTLAPELSRPNGTFTAATQGTGYYNGAGTFVLCEAFEKKGTGGC